METQANGAGGSKTPVLTPAAAAEAEKQFLDELRHRFGTNIKSPYWQIQLLDFLSVHFQKLYPNDWQSHVRDVLKKLFPGMADKLLARFGAYSDYLDWVGQNGSRTYTDMGERRRVMWDKRRALFGEDAKIIWADEIRGEKIAATLESLKTSTAPFSGKAGTFVSTLREAYGDSYRQVDGQVATTELMSEFLKLPSVQEDLHRQSPAQQSESLRLLRSELGMDKDALARWDQLDEQRTQRRSAGETYLAEKAKLEKQYSGDTLQLQVQGLQNRLFGADEAQYIRNEEASGYFRYKEQQVIGVN